MRTSMLLVVALLGAPTVPALAAPLGASVAASQAAQSAGGDQSDAVRVGNMTGVCDTAIGCGLQPLNSPGVPSEPVRVGNLTGVCDTALGCDYSTPAK